MHNLSSVQKFYQAFLLLFEDFKKVPRITMGTIWVVIPVLTLLSLTLLMSETCCNGAGLSSDWNDMSIIFVMAVILGFWCFVFIFLGTGVFFTGKMIGRFVGIIFLGDYRIRKIQSKRLYQVEVILAGKPIRWATTVYLGILSIFGIYAALSGSEGLMFFGETVSWSLPVMALALPVFTAISVVTAYVKKSHVGSLPRPAVKFYYQNKQYKENFCQVIGGMIGLAVICWGLAPVTLIFLHDLLEVFFGSWMSGFVPGSDILNYKTDFFVRISELLFSTDSIIRKGLAIGLPVIFLTMTISFISSTIMRIWVRYRVEGDNGPLQNLIITTLQAVTLFLFVEYFSRKAFFIGDTFDPSWLIFLLLGNFILAMDQAATERSD